jgi:hypothetical protein
MDTTSKSREVPISQISDALESTVAQLDQSRAADLDEMTQVRNARFNVLARDRQRLADKLGADDPRVAALDRGIRLHEEMAAGFRSEIGLSSTPSPQADANSWVLHGNVLDSKRQPLQGLTVALYQKDAWIQAVGYACTDQNGYFVLKVVAAKADVGAVSIRVLRSGKPVYADPRPATVQAGSVEYREIVIGETPDVCPPPGGKADAPPGPAAPSQPGSGGRKTKE